MAGSWGVDQTKALVSIWAQEGVQKELDGVKRNRIVYEGIAQQLAVLGIERTWQQCRSKIKNLTFKYRKVKDSNKVSGGSRIICTFYEEIDAILGHRAASAPAVLLESSSIEQVYECGEQNSVTIPAASRSLTPTEEEESLQNNFLDSTPSTMGDSQSPCSDGEGDATLVSGDGGGCADGSGAATSSSSHCGSTPSGGRTSVARGNGGNTRPCSSIGGEDSRRESTSMPRRRGTRRQRDWEHSAELADIMGELNKQTLNLLAENQRRSMILEAEIEEKRRAQERLHEERMYSMMMNFMQQLSGPSFFPSSPGITHPPPPIPPSFQETSANNSFPSGSYNQENFDDVQ